jgi:hypothetical protein
VVAQLMGGEDPIGTMERAHMEIEHMARVRSPALGSAARRPGPRRPRGPPPRAVRAARDPAAALPIAIDFVVMSDPAQLGEIVRRVRDGRLRTNIGNVATLDDAVAALNPPSDARGRRSSAFVREPHTPTNAP